MELVEATDSDVETLAEYWYALATEMEPYDELNEIAYENPEPAEDGIEGLLEESDTTIYLLTVDGDSVGFVVLREHDHPSREYSARVDIVDLFVESDHRDAGIGSEAVQRAVETAKSWGADQVTVSCEWHNDGARRFYEDNGFEPKQVTYARRLD
ncbi:GNAT family N-acetyltransferase [Halosimplex sp. TS25]|uniref:GNAT family N-acetyltransferase n=1 Tax=Halosimplex rarum TaxID=3396619 RepID=UPI0039EC916D